MDRLSPGWFSYQVAENDVMVPGALLAPPLADTLTVPESPPAVVVPEKTCQQVVG